MSFIESPYIETASGKEFHFLNPTPEMFDIKDIAHALSMNCRFVGQCKYFYSVAEHSVLVSHLLGGTQQALEGLLHDASEAYITDVASPVKDYLLEYKELEDTIMTAFFQKEGLEYPLHPAVKHCDTVMLSTEAHYLLPSQGNTWSMWKTRKRPTVAAGIRPMCLEPAVAKKLFLDRYYELKYGATD